MVDRDSTNELTVLEHRYIEDRSELSKIDCGDKYGLALDIGRLLGDIGDMNRLSGLSNSPQSGLCTRSLRSALPKIGECRRDSEHSGGSPCAIIVAKQHTKSGAANLHRILQHRPEYRFKLPGRTADDLEHVSCRSLLLQRLAKFTQKPRICDRNHSLRGEAFNQFNLPVGERPHFLTINADGADQLVFLEHGNEQQRSPTCKFDDGAVGICRRGVGDMNRSLCLEKRSQFADFLQWNNS